MPFATNGRIGNGLHRLWRDTLRGAQLPQPPLPAMPGGGQRAVGGRPQAGTVAGKVLPCSFYRAAPTAGAVPFQPRNNVQPVVRKSMGNPLPFCQRPQAFGCTVGRHCHIAHLGPANELPPAPAFYCAGRRYRRTWQMEAQQAKRQFPVQCKRDVESVQRSVCKKAAETQDAGQNTEVRAARADQKRLGGVCQTSIRIAPFGGRIPWAVHPPRGHIERPHP